VLNKLLHLLLDGKNNEQSHVLDKTSKQRY